LSLESEGRGIALAKKPCSHIALVVHGVSALPAATWVNVRNGQAVRTLSASDDLAPW
jgi:hypothetical protein